MGNDDARSLDHKTLEALRIRAVGSVQAGESPSAVARTLGVTVRTMYGWLARYRRGGWGGLKAKPLFGRAEIDVHPLFFGHRLDLRVFFLEPLPNQRLIAFDRAMH